MCKNSDCCKGKITAFQVGPNPETDVVPIENILMKLALAESVIADMGRYIQATEENDGMRPNDVEAPCDWALAGLSQNLFEVGHALKCGCWGHEAAHQH